MTCSHCEPQGSAPGFPDSRGAYWAACPLCGRDLQQVDATDSMLSKIAQLSSFGLASGGRVFTAAAPRGGVNGSCVGS
jgi:hypothetical protein